MTSKPIPEKLVKTWSISKEESPPPTQDSQSKSKRVKACFHCRRSKVKCNNNNGDYSNACKRCSKHNLECYYEYKTSKYMNVNDDILPERRDQVVPKSSGNTNGNVSHILKVLENNNSYALTTADQLNLVKLIDKNDSLRKSVLGEKRHRDDMDITNVKKRKFGSSISLKEIISLKECLELFSFFDKNISSQLFGFTLIKMTNIKQLYERNSLLASAVSYISSIHHLNLNLYSTKLKDLLDTLIFRTVVQNGHPNDDFEAFNNILSLCLIGFWLNQNFTGIAIQLAKNSGIGFNRNSLVPNEDKIKLWYLLYTLDGQQSLAYNREPLMTNKDFSINKIKRKLLDNKSSSLFQDIRLVSQVEYNSITNEIFQGRSWDMLDPSRFGVPFKTNMELDKWMVHWTVLLSSLDGFDNNVWSSKSTLIYYNFAKMHVNSKFIRGLMGGNEIFLQWKTNLDEEDAHDETVRLQELDTDEDDDKDDEDEMQLVTEQDPLISSRIATASAMNILQLVLFDNDVVNSLKFCPTHIHVLLYYAVLLSLNSPILSYTEFFKLIKLLKNLLKILSINLPIDKEFGLKLIFYLKKAMVEKFELMLKAGELDSDLEMKLKQELKILKNNAHIEEDYEGDQLGDDNHKKISAWPGTDHSHPVVSNTQIIDFSS